MGGAWGRDGGEMCAGPGASVLPAERCPRWGGWPRSSPAVAAAVPPPAAPPTSRSPYGAAEAGKRAGCPVTARPGDGSAPHPPRCPRAAAAERSPRVPLVPQGSPQPLRPQPSGAPRTHRRGCGPLPEQDRTAGAPLSLPGPGPMRRRRAHIQPGALSPPRPSAAPAPRRRPAPGAGPESGEGPAAVWGAADPFPSLPAAGESSPEGRQLPGSVLSAPGRRGAAGIGDPAAPRGSALPRGSPGMGIPGWRRACWASAQAACRWAAGVPREARNLPTRWGCSEPDPAPPTAEPGSESAASVQTEPCRVRKPLS